MGIAAARNMRSSIGQGSIGKKSRYRKNAFIVLRYIEFLGELAQGIDAVE
ncbi:hypothetical protein [Noviherbaspirillum sp. UKPF54]|nr:hypothetical protein [Noviherbaspirillum sp. UKPF54]